MLILRFQNLFDKKYFTSQYPIILFVNFLGCLMSSKFIGLPFMGAVILLLKK